MARSSTACSPAGKPPKDRSGALLRPRPRRRSGLTHRPERRFAAGLASRPLLDRVIEVIDLQIGSSEDPDFRLRHVRSRQPVRADFLVLMNEVNLGSPEGRVLRRAGLDARHRGVFGINPNTAAK